MPFGKRERGASIGLGAPPTTLSPSLMHNNNCGIPNIVVAAVKSQGAIVKGDLGGLCVKVMMDSGSSISLMMESFAKNYEIPSSITGLKLVSAAGEPIPIIGEVVAPITVGALRVDHNFVPGCSFFNNTSNTRY